MHSVPPPPSAPFGLLGRSWPLLPLAIAVLTAPVLAKLSVLWLPIAALCVFRSPHRPSGQASWNRLLPIPLLFSFCWFGLSLSWTTNLDAGLRAFLDTVAMSLAGGVALYWVKTWRLQTSAAEWAQIRHIAVILYLAAAALLLPLVAAHRLSLHGHLPDSLAFEFILRSNMTDRGVIVLSLLLWPILGLLAKNWQRLGLWLGLTLMVAASNSLAAKLVMVVGGVVFLATQRWPRRVAQALPFLGLLLLLLMPMLAQSFYSWGWHHASWLPQSSQHRIQIWDFVARQAALHPWLGWGINAARDFPNMNEVPVLGKVMLPMHPHNGALQLWLEFGAVGVALCASWWLWLCQRLTPPTLSPTTQVGYASTVAQTIGILLIACTTFGLWASYWQAWIWLVIILREVLAFAAADVPATTP